eukprot:91993-Chlamydomonas_euryale.AAC.5
MAEPKAQASARTAVRMDLSCPRLSAARRFCAFVSARSGDLEYVCYFAVCPKRISRRTVTSYPFDKPALPLLVIQLGYLRSPT